MKLGASLNFKIPSNFDSGKKGTLKYTLSYRMGTDKQICFSHSYMKGQPQFTRCGNGITGPTDRLTVSLG